MIYLLKILFPKWFRVHDQALVLGRAKVFENANLYGYSTLHDSALVYGHAIVDGFTDVHDKSRIYGFSRVWGCNSLIGNTQVFDQANICNVSLDYSKVHGCAKIVGLEPNEDSYYACIGESDIYGDVTIQGPRINIAHSTIHGQLNLSGNIFLNGCYLEGDITYEGKRKLEDIHWWRDLP